LNEHVAVIGRQCVHSFGEETSFCHSPGWTEKTTQYFIFRHWTWYFRNERRISAEL